MFHIALSLCCMHCSVQCLVLDVLVDNMFCIVNESVSVAVNSLKCPAVVTHEKPVNLICSGQLNLFSHWFRSVKLLF